MSNRLTKPVRLSRRAVYQNAWVNLFVDRVRLPTGRIIEDFHLLDYETSAVGAVVIDRRGRILMERIQRYATGTEGWELPAGGAERGESPAKAAQREVFEETGYRTLDPTLLYTYFPMNGSSNKVFHVVQLAAGVQIGTIDPHEVEEIRWFSKSELRRMLKARRIHDGLTLTALLLVL